MEGTVLSGPDDRPGRRAVPVRTCIGCRGREEQSLLLRVYAVQHETASLGWLIVPDPRRRGPGRGAYLHPDPACLQSAIARRALGRALRLPAGSPWDLQQVQQWLHQQS